MYSLKYLVSNNKYIYEIYKETGNCYMGKIGLEKLHVRATTYLTKISK
jgi:hypothetical protein